MAHCESRFSRSRHCSWFGSARRKSARRNRCGARAMSCGRRLQSWKSSTRPCELRTPNECGPQRSGTCVDEDQRLSSTGSFARKIASGELFWSTETHRIMGFDETVKPTVGVLLQRVHPDDRKLLQQQLDRAAQSEQDYEYEGRL